MWYFAWILGVTMAALAGILNGIWLEMHLEDEAHRATRPGPRMDIPNPGEGNSSGFG